jgi:hypothetical protein
MTAFGQALTSQEAASRSSSITRTHGVPVRMPDRRLITFMHHSWHVPSP